VGLQSSASPCWFLSSNLYVEPPLLASGLSQKEAAAPEIGGFDVGYVLILPANMVKLDHDHINKLDIVSKEGSF